MLHKIDLNTVEIFINHCGVSVQTENIETLPVETEIMLQVLQIKVKIFFTQ